MSRQEFIGNESPEERRNKVSKQKPIAPRIARRIIKGGIASHNPLVRDRIRSDERSQERLLNDLANRIEAATESPNQVLWSHSFYFKQRDEGVNYVAAPSGWLDNTGAPLTTLSVPSANGNISIVYPNAYTNSLWSAETVNFDDKNVSLDITSLGVAPSGGASIGIYVDGSKVYDRTNAQKRTGAAHWLANFVVASGTSNIDIYLYGHSKMSPFSIVGDLAKQVDSFVGISGVLGTGGGVTDHGALTGLTDDDHTQYLKLVGRTGGQTVFGGTSAGDGINLLSNPGTDGTTTLDSVMTIKGDTNRVGINQTKPSYDIDIVGDASVSGSLFVAAGGTNQLSVNSSDITVNTYILPKSDISTNIGAHNQRFTWLFGQNLEATAAYFDDLYDNSAGNVTAHQALSMNSNKVTDLADPTLTTDSANKGYVDDAIAASSGDPNNAFLHVDGSLASTGVQLFEAGLVASGAVGYHADLAADASEVGLNVYWAGNLLGKVGGTAGLFSVKSADDTTALTIGNSTITTLRHIVPNVAGAANLGANSQEYAWIFSQNLQTGSAYFDDLYDNSAGTVTAHQALSMNSNKVTDLADPTLTTDSANKGYVDDTVATASGNLTNTFLHVDGSVASTGLQVFEAGLEASGAGGYYTDLAADASEAGLNVYWQNNLLGKIGSDAGSFSIRSADNTTALTIGNSTTTTMQSIVPDSAGSQNIGANGTEFAWLFSNNLQTGTAYFDNLYDNSAGNVTVHQELDLGSNKITSVATPTVDNDAANKVYVDDAIVYVSGHFLSADGSITSVGDQTFTDGLTASGDLAAGFWIRIDGDPSKGITATYNDNQAYRLEHGNGTLVIHSADDSNALTISDSAITVVDDVVPFANLQYNLGSSSRAFASGYFGVLKGDVDQTTISADVGGNTIIADHMADSSIHGGGNAVPTTGGSFTGDVYFQKDVHVSGVLYTDTIDVDTATSLGFNAAVDMNSNRVKNIAATPLASTDATSKDYVDTQRVAAINTHEAAVDPHEVYVLADGGRWCTNSFGVSGTLSDIYLTTFGTNDPYIVFDHEGTEIGRIGGSVNSYLSLQGPGATPNFYLWSTVTTCRSDFRPYLSSTYNLGTATYPWSTTYTDAIEIGGSAFDPTNFSHGSLVNLTSADDHTQYIHNNPASVAPTDPERNTITAQLGASSLVLKTDASSITNIFEIYDRGGNAFWTVGALGRMDFNVNSTAQVMLFKGDTDSNLLVINSAGNDKVGIGLSSPRESAKLEVDGKVYATEFIPSASPYSGTGPEPETFGSIGGNQVIFASGNAGSDFNWRADASGYYGFKWYEADVEKAAMTLNTSSRLLEFSGVDETTIDHGGLGGLTDDDHSQYIMLAPGSTARNTIEAGSDINPFSIKAVAGQTSHVFILQNSSAANIFYLTADGAVVANEAGADSDSRIESQNQAYAFHVDASKDNVRINAVDSGATGSSLTVVQKGSLASIGHGTNSALRLQQPNTASAIGAQIELQFCGWNMSDASYAEATIGFETTSNGGSEMGKLYFATRGVTTNSSPTKRLEILDSGETNLLGNTLELDSAGTIDIKPSGNFLVLEDVDSGSHTLTETVTQHASLEMDALTSTTNKCIFITSRNIEIDKVYSWCSGSGFGTISLEWNIAYGLNDAGTDIFISEVTTTDSTDIRSDVPDTTSIPIGNGLWFQASKENNTISEFIVTVVYHYV